MTNPPHPPHPPQTRYAIEWRDHDGVLRAVEPDAAELSAAAPLLAAYYNDSHNRSMMAHSSDMTAVEVLEHYERIAGEGGRNFLLYLNDALMGDADLRHLEADRAEFAWMVGARAAQGKGLGTRFGIMVNAFAFHVLGRARMYATVLAANHGSRRALAKLGYQPDDSPLARAYADDPSDICLSVARAHFERHQAGPLAHIEFNPRKW